MDYVKICHYLAFLLETKTRTNVLAGVNRNLLDLKV
jgi:hypothetical protein